MFDVGVNLLSKQFRKDRDAVLSRARSAGVKRQIVISGSVGETRAAIDMGADTGFGCTAGVHPHHAAEVDQDWLPHLLALAQHPLVCAIGETGLDFNRNFSPPETQLAVFTAQIKLAQQVNKPLYLHDRESDGELMRSLEAAGPLPPVLVHCFTGTAQELENYLAAGFYIGITGWVTDPKRGAELREMVPRIPLNRLMIETDAPYLRPANVPPDWLAQQGLSARYKRRCEPALLPYIAAAIAQLYRVAPAEIAAATSANALHFFKASARSL